METQLVSRAREFLRQYDVPGYEEAVPLFKEALEKDAGCAEAYAGLAETYAYWGFRREICGQEHQSLFDMAYDCAEAALRLAPDKAVCHRAMAVALRRGAKADAGRRRSEVMKALELDPKDAESWCERWRVEGYDPDDPVIARIESLDPKLCALHIDRGAALCELGRLDEALAELHEALKINPRNLHAYYDVAMVLDRKGLREKAVAVLRKALVMSPNDPLIEGGLSLLGEPEAS